MHASEPLPARLIGALFVERGLVSESQIRVALEIQRETGQQLGQVLVERFGVSRKELASVVAEQWAKLGGSSGPEDSASWRRLGEIFVERGFVTGDELEQALTRQRQTGERLGEALVAQGVISKFELAGALAEQMSTLEDLAESDTPAEQPEATVHHLPMRAPDPAEIPFGTVVEIEPSAEPELPAEDDAEHVAGDVGEIASEPGPVAAEVGGVALEAGDIAQDVEEVHVEFEAAAVDEIVLDVVDEAHATPGPVEVIAIDDVGHVTFVGGTTEAVEPERPEAEPLEAEPDLTADDDAEHVAGDVGEIASEPGLVAAEVGEVALETEDVAEDVGETQVEFEAAGVDEVVLEVVDEADAGAGAIPEPVEVSAIDDVGHVSFVGGTTEAVEPEHPEAEPPALFDDLRQAIAAEAFSADGQQPEPLVSVACLVFAPTTDGYRLVALESLPEPGETIAVPDVGERLVLRVGRSPIPGDNRMCAFVEEPVTPAPVTALAY